MASGARFDLYRGSGNPLNPMDPAMPNLARLRTLSFHAQSGRCYYCGLPMWLTCPSELGLRPRSAAPYQCTAEHLQARQDGGRDVAGNIVAACRLCNARRHKRKSAPPPEEYKALVQKRLAKGKWFNTTQARLLRPGSSEASELLQDTI